MQFFQSSNPAISAAEKEAFEAHYGGMSATRPTEATVAGVVNKTTILVLIAMVAGALAYKFIQPFGGAMTISAIAAFIVCLGAGFMICGNPKLATVLGPIYAIVEGVFLGLLTSVLDKWLLRIESLRAVESGAVADGAAHVSLALPAVLITVSVAVTMLALYYLRILRPTRKFVAIVSTAAGAVFLTYLLAFVLSFFNVSIPFLSLNSAIQGGTAGLIGIGISVVILGIASLMLIIDFGRVEAIVSAGSPKYMEWFAAFGLLVTLAWIYYEAVKLCFRLYLLFGSRD